MKRTVTRPRLSRPPVFLRGSVSERSGVLLVISSNVRWVMWRRPGDVGLNFLSAISLCLVEELDHLLALLQDDVGLLPVRALAHEPALALHLAVDVGDADLLDLHAEEGLHRLLDLGLGGVAVDLEAQGALGLLEVRGLFRDEGPPEDFVDVLHGLPTA